MNQLLLAPDAAQDLEAIWEYIAAENIDAAGRFIDKLYGKIFAIAEDPGIGHLRRDLAENRPLLFYPVGNYLVLYRADKGLVEIVAIVHGKRDVPSFLAQRDL